MTKRDYIWVAIRVFGIYLLVLAVVAVPSLIGDAIRVWGFRHRLSEFSSVGEGELASWAGWLQTALSSSVSSLVTSGGRVLLFGFVGTYLVRSGKLLFRWIYPPEADSPTAADIETPVP